jgi:hypothetical protein
MQNWDIILTAAFAAIGVIEYIKGFFPTAPGWVWRITMPVSCLVFGAIAALAPAWVMTGILALALSQVGYQLIIETIKRKFGSGAKADDGAGK